MLEIKEIIYNHKLLFIVVMGILTTSALTFLVNCTFLVGEPLQSITIMEKNGVYDLRNINEFDKNLIRLIPTENYYPNTYLIPERENKDLAKSIDEYKDIRANFLSQEFVLKVPDNNSIYKMTFSLSGRHAMRVYVNGILVAQTGRLGTSKKDTEIWENNISFNGSAVKGEIDIILHSAQFYHAKRGASLAELSLNTTEITQEPFFFDKIKGLIVVGALLCAAVLLLGMYLILSHTRPTLYFALACIVMAIREGLQSQAWTYFPIPGNISFMLEYLSVVFLTIFLSLYLGQYITGRFLRIIQYIAIIVSLIYGICVVFGDSIFYTSILKYYQILLVICIVPGIIILFWKMRHPIMEQATAMFGITVFYLAAIYDIVMYSDIFGDRLNAPISELAMLIFVIAQMVSLFQMNNRVLVEAKEAEQKLAGEKITLEKINRLKTEFLGNVSHELKTPLTVMSGYAQTTKQLAQKPGILDKEEVSRRMVLISSEAERLSLMVGQVLEVTRMEEGRMVMNPRRCYMDEIIHTSVETHYPILNKNQNRLDIRIDRGLPAIYADPTRIAQVIVNLLSNAVRFTTEGLITISAKKENDKILICVSDTGIGISPERIPHIFDRYEKKQISDGNLDMGTGLGLYICKHMVEEHRGKIWIESENGQGTSVFFTLPLNNN